MSHDLQNRLRALRTNERRIQPDPAWVRATRETLLMQVRNTLPARAPSMRERVRHVLDALAAGRMVQFVRRPIMAFLSILAVLTGGSVMSVSAAERSLPGDFLYGLKLATEQARLAWVSAKEEKLKLKTEFTGRRVEELKEVANTKKDNERVKQVAEILKQDLSTLKEQLGEVRKDVSAEKVVAVAKLVDEKSNEVINALQETKIGLSSETKEKMTEAQSAAADTGVKAIEVLVEQHEESSDIVPVADVTEIIQNHANAVANIVQVPLELSSATTSSSSTVATLIQAIATSTAAGTTSTLPLTNLVTQVKDITAQVFALQKAQDQLEAFSASGTGETTTNTASSTSDTPTSTAAPTSSLPTSPP